MSALTLTLSEAETERLQEVAAALGAAPEELAAAAVRERLAEDQVWVETVEAGIAEIDAGQGVSFEAFSAELDQFLAALEV